VVYFLFFFIFSYVMVWGDLGYISGCDYIFCGFFLLRFRVCDEGFGPMQSIQRFGSGEP
jgi:hypothetical protein